MCINIYTYSMCVELRARSQGGDSGDEAPRRRLSET